MAKIALLVIVVGLSVGTLFWAKRAFHVVRTQLYEYAPTPYAATEGGRRALADATNWGEIVDWTLGDGSRQQAYFRAPDGTNRRLVIFAHGSPSNGLGMYGGEAKRLAERGYGILLLDLPGYGESEGDRGWGPSFVESFLRAVDFASGHDQVDPDAIAAFGYSNGGSVVARAAAADDRIQALVLLASYSNLRDQLHYAWKRRTPFLPELAIAVSQWSGVDVDALDSLSALRAMSPRPMLVIWGGRDIQIAPWMGPALKSAVPGAEELVYSEMGHLDYAGQLGSTYIDALDEFLTRSLEKRPRTE